MVLIRLLKEQNLKDAFSELVLGFLNWLSNVKFKDPNDSISNSS